MKSDKNNPYNTARSAFWRVLRTLTRELLDCDEPRLGFTPGLGKPLPDLTFGRRQPELKP